MDTKALLFLLQICDGNFPNGAFSHSFGLETLIEQGIVHDAASFEVYLEEWFHFQVIPFDGLSTHLAWEEAVQANISGLLELVRVTAASILPQPTKSGVLRIGRSTLEVLGQIVPGGVTERLLKSLREEKGSLPFSIAFATAAAEMGIGQAETIAASLYTSLSVMVATAVRAVPIGQTQGQLILGRCREWIEALPSYEGLTFCDLSSAAPQWEIAQMHQKFLDGKLFMS